MADISLKSEVEHVQARASYSEMNERRRAGGREAIRTEDGVRFADDIVVGFNSKADPDQSRAEFTKRMRKFNLKLEYSSWG